MGLSVTHSLQEGERCAMHPHRTRVSGESDAEPVGLAWCDLGGIKGLDESCVECKHVYSDRGAIAAVAQPYRRALGLTAKLRIAVVSRTSVR